MYYGYREEQPRPLRDTSSVGNREDEAADALRLAFVALVDDGEAPLARSTVRVDREPGAPAGRGEGKGVEDDVPEQRGELRLVGVEDRQPADGDERPPFA